LPLAPRLTSLATSQEKEEATRWIASFRDANIIRDDVELSFSRSSGPGGQNVNKVNSKATVRCLISANWIPLWAHEILKRSPAFVQSSNSLLITSMVHRSQSQNVDDCLSKLHALILSAASSVIKKEPSAEKLERIRGYIQQEKARRRLGKGMRAEVKRARS
ncbi:hypothetical protein SISSUDRAFT_956600, partial [Sistotremastrum suecicum HHB10207 ss-3]